MQLKRAQGCMMGQLAGDSLGSLVEFKSGDRIRAMYPEGVRDLADGGTFNTLAGQPTDDSEMALLIARSIIERGTYDRNDAFDAYLYWRDTRPFDIGNTISAALRGTPKPESQANGAMMRVSPLGIFGSNYDLAQVAEWAMVDAALTHPNPVCLQANSLYTKTIALAIREGPAPNDLYRAIVSWAEEEVIDQKLMIAIRAAEAEPPADFLTYAGWVLIAFQNALYHLNRATDFEEAVVETVMGGGDTDTNAAICGALFGAVHGIDTVPERWVNGVLNCRPEAGKPRVANPRPEVLWPVDALELVEGLLW